MQQPYSVMPLGLTHSGFNRYFSQEIMEFQYFKEKDNVENHDCLPPEKICHLYKFHAKIILLWFVIAPQARKKASKTQDFFRYIYYDVSFPTI